MPLYLIRQPPPPGTEPPGGEAARVATEWTDQRYADLVAAWESVRPPPGFVGFMDPLP